jgi:Putative DNA-binding domain/EC042_2821-lke REase
MVKKKNASSANPARERRDAEFKESFDPSVLGEWCEIIKDIVAIANSGGGSIFIGINDAGSPVGSDISCVLEIDQAKLVDKISKYLGENFFDVEILQREWSGSVVAEIHVGTADIPLIFAQPGTYEVSPGKQKTAFSRGTIYFRHGAKSEPGNSKDIRRFVEAEISRVRKSWLGGIRKVVHAPKGHEVRILPPDVIESSSPSATPIRFTDDPNAPAYRKIDPDKTHPYRQKDIISEVNKRLEEKVKISSFDFQCARRMHKIDLKPEFFYKSKFATPQYSEAFIGWLTERFGQDPDFFAKARDEFKRLSHPTSAADAETATHHPSA